MTCSTFKTEIWKKWNLPYVIRYQTVLEKFHSRNHFMIFHIEFFNTALIWYYIEMHKKTHKKPKKRQKPQLSGVSNKTMFNVYE